MSMASYDENVIGFLAVPSDDLKDILDRGFVVSTQWGQRVPSDNSPKPQDEGREICHTSRKEVPFSRDIVGAVAAMRKWRNKVERSTVLQLRRKSKSGMCLLTSKIFDGTTMLPEGREKRDSVLPDPITFSLDPMFIDVAMVFERGAHEFEGAPCPICDGSLEGVDSERGKVGLCSFIENAFMVVPCPNESCKEWQFQRQGRLETMVKMTLYHACSKDIAEKIKATGGKMIRGTQGAGGGGIYLAHTARETEWKAEIKSHEGTRILKKFKEDSQNVVVLAVEAKLGKMKLGGRFESNMTFASLAKEGFDSCVLDRGETGYPGDKVPEAPVDIQGKSTMSGTHPGYEFVVYSWDQVRVLGEVPRDPIPVEMRTSDDYQLS